MTIGNRFRELMIRIRHERFRTLARRAFRHMRDRISPPWYNLYWIPVAEVSEPGNCTSVPPGYETFHKLMTRLMTGVELRVVKSLDELKECELQALVQYLGSSKLPVYRQRLSQGAELHLLFTEGRVVGSVFFVLGKARRFQHVVLTDRDAMGLDGRVDPAFRGRGLYPVFLLLSITRLRRSGIDQLFIDCVEHNEEASRSFSCIGFRYLLRYRLERDQYRFDQTAL